MQLRPNLEMAICRRGRYEQEWVDLRWSQWKLRCLPLSAYHKDPKSHASVDSCHDNSDDFNEKHKNLNDILIKILLRSKAFRGYVPCQLITPCLQRQFWLKSDWFKIYSSLDDFFCDEHEDLMSMAVESVCGLRLSAAFRNQNNQAAAAPAWVGCHNPNHHPEK